MFFIIIVVDPVKQIQQIYGINAADQGKDFFQHWQYVIFVSM
jgi:hypothetical protein